MACQVVVGAGEQQQQPEASRSEGTSFLGRGNGNGIGPEAPPPGCALPSESPHSAHLGHPLTPVLSPCDSPCLHNCHCLASECLLPFGPELFPFHDWPTRPHVCAQSSLLTKPSPCPGLAWLGEPLPTLTALTSRWGGPCMRVTVGIRLSVFPG